MADNITLADQSGANAREQIEPAARKATRRRNRWRRTPAFIAGIVIVGLVVIAGIVGPLLSPYDPIANDLGSALLPASSSHWLGTDQFGRDLLTRILYAVGIDLQIGVVGVAITFVIGVIMGSVAGYFGGWFDDLVGRLIDIVVAFPYIVLVLAIVAVLGPGIVNIYIAIAIVGWVSYTRIMRAQILVVRQQQYVEAARALGVSNTSIIRRHIIPNTISAALVYAMSDVVLNLRLVVALSFLGLGVPPPTPEWGSMIGEGQQFLLTNWGLSTWPGLAIVIVGIGFSLLGDGIADLLRTK